MAEHAFPDDLVALRRDFEQTRRDLLALPAADRDRRAGLRARERRLAVELSGHPHWQQYEGGERTAAKTALHILVAAEGGAQQDPPGEG